VIKSYKIGISGVTLNTSRHQVRSGRRY